MDAVPVTFTLSELWVLQGVVRHESAQPWQGKWPITSVELNDRIAEAIWFCTNENQQEAAIILTRGDCYLIDALVPASAKDTDGKLVGKPILLKTYHVRSVLADGIEATAAESPEPPAEQWAKLKEWKEPWTRFPWRLKANAQPGTEPNPDPDDLTGYDPVA